MSAPEFWRRVGVTTCSVVLLAAVGCRLPQQTIRFGTAPAAVAGPADSPPLAFFAADIDVVKEGNGFAEHDEVELRTVALKVLRAAYGPPRPAAPRVHTQLTVRSPNLDVLVWGTEPVLTLEVDVATTLPSGVVVTTRKSHVVDQGTAFASSILLPGAAVLAATTWTFIAAGVLLMAVSPALGLAVLAAAAVVMIPGALLFGGVSIWSSVMTRNKTTAIATQFLVDTLELHARAIAEGMTRAPAAPTVESAILPFPPEAPRRGEGRIRVLLSDPTACLSKVDLVDDVNALLPADVAPGLYSLEVNVQPDDRHRNVEVLLFKTGEPNPHLVREIRLAENECETLPRFIARMVRSNVNGSSSP